MSQSKDILRFCKENKEEITSAKSIGITLLDNANELLGNQESLDAFKSICKKNRNHGAMRFLVPKKYLENISDFFSKDTLQRATFKGIHEELYDDFMKAIEQENYEIYFVIIGNEPWDEIIKRYETNSTNYKLLDHFIKVWTYDEIKEEPKVFAKGVNRDHWEFYLQYYSCNNKWKTIRKNHFTKVNKENCDNYPYLWELKRYSNSL